MTVERLTANFSRHELACPCCGQCEMSPVTLERLQRLRDIYGKPIHIAKGGGYRCAKYPCSPQSAHKEGKAVDPAIPREDMYDLLQAAFLVGFTGVGLKQNNGQWQIHLDDADAEPNRPRPWIWTYNSET